MSLPEQSHRSPSLELAPCVAAYVISTMASWLQPAIIDALRHGLGFSAALAGVLAGIEVGTIAAVSICLGLGMQRLTLTPRTLALAGCAFVVVGNAISMLVENFDVLIAARLSAGVGGGCTLAAVTAILARSVAPHRIGRVIGGATLGAGLMLVVVPWVCDPFAHRGVFGLMGIVALVLSSIVARFPNSTAERADPHATSIGSWCGWLLFGASVLWSTITGMLWAFSFDLGSAAGFGLKAMGIIGGVSILFGALGGVAVAAIGSRIPRIRLLNAMIAVQSAMTLLIIRYSNSELFVAGFMVLLFTFYFCYPLVLGIAIDLDPAGGVSAMIAGSISMGGVVGPILGGLLLGWTGNYSLISLVIAVTLPAMIAVFTIADRHGRIQSQQYCHSYIDRRVSQE